MTNDDQTKQEVRKVFDRIANREDWERLYAGAPNRLTYNFISRQRAVEEMLACIRLGQVLELGCGTGDLSPFLMERASGYTGVDISEAMIERARANYGRQIGTGRARFEVGDCERLQFGDASFEMVVAVALIEYLPDPSKALDEMRRVLKPGGRLAISTWQVAQTDELRPVLKELGLPSTRAPGWITEPGALEALITRNGFTGVSVTVDSMDFRYADAEEFWQQARGTIVRRQLDPLDPQQKKHALSLLTERMKPHQRADGYYLRASALFAVANI